MRSMIFLFAAWMCASGVQAANSVTAGGVVLLQPEKVIKARISGDKIAPYLKQVDAAAMRTFKVAKPVPASGGFLVVAMRPGQKSMFWLDFAPPLPKALADELLASAQSVWVPPVTDGTVVVALEYGVGGGRKPMHTMPSPPEWVSASAAAGKPLEIGELVDRIWK